MLSSRVRAHGAASRALAAPPCLGLRHLRFTGAAPRIGDGGLPVRGHRVRSSEEDNLQETKLGPNVLAGIKDFKENTQWTAATVIKNECVQELPDRCSPQIDSCAPCF